MEDHTATVGDSNTACAKPWMSDKANTQAIDVS